MSNTMNKTTTKMTDDVKILDSRINISTMGAEDIPRHIGHVAWMSAIIAVEKFAKTSRWLSVVDILVHKHTDLRACEAHIKAFGQPCRIYSGLVNPHGVTKVVKVLFASEKSILDEVEEIR